MAETANTEGSAKGKAKPRGNPSKLKPFPKGVSGNPGGSSRAQKFAAMIAKKIPDPDFVELVIAQMKSGNTALILDHRNRVEGKVVDKVESHQKIVYEIVEEDPDAEE